MQWNIASYACLLCRYMYRVFSTLYTQFTCTYQVEAQVLVESSACKVTFALVGTQRASHEREYILHHVPTPTPCHILFALCPAAAAGKAIARLGRVMIRWAVTRLGGLRVVGCGNLATIEVSVSKKRCNGWLISGYMSL